jgi:thiol-disulfide isomerase/thioredoxin
MSPDKLKFLHVALKSSQITFEPTSYFKTCVYLKLASKNMKKSLFTMIFILLTIVSFGQKKVKRTPVKIIPQMTIYDINGKTTTLKALSNNKVTFIDFWFVPCSPCFEEMGMLHNLYKKYKSDPNVSFLTITFTDSSAVRPLIENRNTKDNKTYDYFKSLSKLDTFKLPVYFASGKTSKGFFIEAQQDLSNKFGFSGYPTIFIFDEKGKVIYNKTGFTKEGEKQQQKNIEALINAKI